MNRKFKLLKRPLPFKVTVFDINDAPILRKLDFSSYSVYILLKNLRGWPFLILRWDG